MNRDGYRSGRDVAEHEAAHAVVAILSGLAIGRVSIAPTLSQRGNQGGWIEPGRKILRMCNGKPVLAPITETADLDTLAAGYTWETEVLDHTEDEAGAHADMDLRIWIASTEGKMTVLDAVEAFGDAADRLGDLFERPDVQAAVRAVADRLQSGKSGEIWGTTVEKICRRHGLRVGVAA